MAQNNRAVGTKYEEYAEQFLKKQGVIILARNFRCRQGEIDIIGIEKNCLVFVEVKYRATGNAGEPEEAVNIFKQKKICRVAEFFLYTHPYYSNQLIRYDVVAILGEEMRWHKAAFEHIGV